MFAYATFGPPLRHTVSGDVPPLGSNGVMTFPFAVILALPVTTKTVPLVGGLNVGQPDVSTVSKEKAASFIVMWCVCCVRDAADTFAGDCPKTDNSMVKAAEKSAAFDSGFNFKLHGPRTSHAVVPPEMGV